MGLAREITPSGTPERSWQSGPSGSLALSFGARYRAAYPNVWIVVIVGAGFLLGPGAQTGADDAPQLAGTWNWSWKDQNGRTHHHVLEIEGVTTKLADGRGVRRLAAGSR